MRRGGSWAGSLTRVQDMGNIQKQGLLSGLDDRDSKSAGFLE